MNEMRYTLSYCKKRQEAVKGRAVCGPKTIKKIYLLMVKKIEESFYDPMYQKSWPGGAVTAFGGGAFWTGNNAADAGKRGGTRHQE
jgi:hypothetical protein